MYMKKLIIKFSIIACLMFLPTLSSNLFAQAPPKPPSSDGGTTVIHGASTDQAGAPIDGGLSILLLLGSAYGGVKRYLLRKKEKK